MKMIKTIQLIIITSKLRENQFLCNTFNSKFPLRNCSLMKCETKIITPSLRGSYGNLLASLSGLSATNT